MLSDPIADFLARIKNGYMAKRSLVELPWSRILAEMAEILVANDYLAGAEVKEDRFKTLILNLKYKSNQPALTDLKRVSKPGVRRYIKVHEIRPVLDGLGMMIISTPKGLMTGKEAKKKNLGGEVLAEIW